MTPPLQAPDADAASLAACRLELAQALEQQAAMREILGVISRLPADPQPVFDAIVAAGVHLFGDAAVAISRPEGDWVRPLAIAGADPERARHWLSRVFPFPLSPEYIHGAAMLGCRTIDVPDLLEPGGPMDVGKRNLASSGYRAMAVVPLVRDGRAIGAIAVVRVRPGALTARQLALMQTFADQALIAIENARLFNEREARHRELAEALEQQRATSEILRVISRSTSDVQPVFDTIAQAALRLCEASIVNVVTYDGERLHVRAMAGIDPRGQAAARSVFPRAPSRETVAGMAVLTRDVFVIEDVLTDPDYVFKSGADWGLRGALGLPLLRDGLPIGALAICRPRPGPFDAKLVALLRTFADQAVIALENVRLFNETREALDRQTATGEILASMSGSMTDTQPVFDAIARNLLRLLGTRFAIVALAVDGRIEIASIQGEPGFEKLAESYPIVLDDESHLGRTILSGRVSQLAPIVGNPATPPLTERNALRHGYDTQIAAPMRRAGKVIGAIVTARRDAVPFDDRQTALITSFADQAVIAIENVRLFTELQDKTRELEIASRHKTAFLANMSHELRTPLNAILGFTRIVQRETRGRIAPRQTENLDKILASARHLVGLINATLDLTRIEAGRIEIRPSEADLARLLDQCLRLVEPLCADGVRLEARLAASLPPLLVDAEKLHQIVLNLLGNAVKFTQAGRIELRAAARDDRVVVDVEDTGIGIPPDKLEAVFEEFEQVDAGHARAHGGTGLGLAIARRLARAMGGELTAVSAPGVGSTFTLTLPQRWTGADEA